jgi:hypothetical protein
VEADLGIIETARKEFSLGECGLDKKDGIATNGFEKQLLQHRNTNQ